MRSIKAPPVFSLDRLFDTICVLDFYFKYSMISIQRFVKGKGGKIDDFFYDRIKTV